jgi:hypothetical protein
LRGWGGVDTLIATVQKYGVLHSVRLARHVRCVVLLALACGFGGRSALADPPPAATAAAGAFALSSGRIAFAGRRWKDAEALYKSALDHGGLAPQETLEAYVHLGAARAALGRHDLARVAFRQAALIDAHFKVPREAGKHATAYAAAAKKEEAKLGSIVLNATIPQSVPAAESFGVDATLDARHARVTAKIGILARDPLTGRAWASSEVAATTVHFDVPADVVMPGATLVLRVDALDPHDNRLATREQRVRVEEAAPPPTIAALPAAQPASGAAPATFTFTTDSGSRDKSAKHGGFWSTPWPYFLGGLVLAAGGAVTYYELHPTDDVSLAARVTTH